MSQVTTTTAQEYALSIELVRNVSYRPDLNGIEQYWGACKREYRSRIDWYKAQHREWDQQTLVQEVCGGIPNEDVKKFALDGENKLLGARPILPDPEGPARPALRGP